MPSLTVDNHPSPSWKDTYRNYLGTINEKELEYDSHAIQYIPYFKWIISFIILNLIYLVWFLGLQMFTSHYRSVYDEYNLYYIHDTFIIMIQILFAAMFSINFCSKILNKPQKCFIIFVSILIHGIIGGPIFLYLSYVFHNEPNNVISRSILSESICDKIPFNCASINIFFFYQFLIYPSLSITQIIIIKWNTFNRWWCQFILIFIVYLFIFYWLTIIKISVYQNNFETWYICLSFTSSFFKFMLKRTARKIDQFRVYYIRQNQVILNDNNDKNYFLLQEEVSESAEIKNESEYGISLEMFCEGLMSMFYWVAYRYAVSFHVPTVQNFVVSMILHLLSETMESNFKFTKVYYRFYRYYTRSMQCYNPTQSTLNQWRLRLSLDINIRLCISMLSAIFNGLIIICTGPKGLQLNNHDYKYSNVYNISNGMIEFAHFLSLILWIHCYYKLDVIKPFYRLINVNQRRIFIVSGFCFSMFAWCALTNSYYL